MKYINNFKLESNPHKVEVKEAKYLPPNSLVLAGSQIFSIFF
jgi:hypothetical protein